MADDPIRASRVAARLTVAGAVAAIAATGLAFGPFAAAATAGGCLFLFGLALGMRVSR